MNQDLIMAKKIAEAVKTAGGDTYFVGGYVRDRLMDIENKDIDIEVHGISVEALTEILGNLGRPVTKGAFFGIFGLEHYNLDIAMPRSEKATGRGHKDFEIFVDPFIGPEKAAGRRDFTINALMQDVLSEEILDFFDGRRDLENKVIRHVDDAHFAEDPLRVFRAAQFSARFGFDINSATVTLSQKMNVTVISRERVMSELEKALLKAACPSLFFEKLRILNQLDFWFPEVKSLIGCPQDPSHHPEGDVWVHTLQVLDEAAKLRKEARDPRALMFSALCHDLGKPLVTTEKNGHVHAYDHENAGLAVAKTLLDRLTAQKNFKKTVLNMTLLHMQPNMKVFLDVKPKSYMKLFDQSVCPEDLLLLAKADHLGRQGEHTDPQKVAEDYLPVEMKLRKQLANYHKLMAQPHVIGKDLLEAGITPGPAFSDGLAYAHKLRLAGLSKDDQLRQTLGYLRKWSS